MRNQQFTCERVDSSALLRHLLSNTRKTHMNIDAQGQGSVKKAHGQFCVTLDYQSSVGTPSVRVVRNLHFG